MASFLWWIVGFYWVVSGGELLLVDAPRLYWCASLPSFQSLSIPLPLTPPLIVRHKWLFKKERNFNIFLSRSHSHSTWNKYIMIDPCLLRTILFIFDSFNARIELLAQTAVNVPAFGICPLVDFLTCEVEGWFLK